MLVKDIELSNFNDVILDYFKSKGKYVDDLHCGNYRLSYTLRNKEYVMFNGIDLSSYIFHANNLHELYYTVYRFFSIPQSIGKKINIITSDNTDSYFYDIYLQTEPYYLFTYDELFFYLGEKLDSMTLDELSNVLINMLFMTENDDKYSNYSLKCIKV